MPGDPILFWYHLKGIYEEIKKMRQIDFDFMDNEDPYSKVEDLSDNMTVMPL